MIDSSRCSYSSGLPEPAAFRRPGANSACYSPRIEDRRVVGAAHRHPAADADDTRREDAGAAYLTRAEDILAALEEADQAARGTVLLDLRDA
jgi:hypothetical protein